MTLGKALKISGLAALNDWVRCSRLGAPSSSNPNRRDRRHIRSNNVDVRTHHARRFFVKSKLEILAAVHCLHSLKRAETIIAELKSRGIHLAFEHELSEIEQRKLQRERLLKRLDSHPRPSIEQNWSPISTSS